VAVDTTPGPVDAVIRHRPELEAREILEAQARRARLARRVDVPERWMVTQRGDKAGAGNAAASIGDGSGSGVPRPFEEQDSPSHDDQS
jgi:putative membrane protein